MVIKILGKGCPNCQRLEMVARLALEESGVEAVIEKVTDALVEAVGAPRDAVRVMVLDVPKTQWGIAGKTAKELGR